MLILGLAAATYGFFFFLGCGLARLALPRSLILYRAWLAPWLGLSAAVVLLGWMSRLGMSIARLHLPRRHCGSGSRRMEHSFEAPGAVASRQAQLAPCRSIPDHTSSRAVSTSEPQRCTDYNLAVQFRCGPVCVGSRLPQARKPASASVVFPSKPLDVLTY